MQVLLRDFRAAQDTGIRWLYCFSGRKAHEKMVMWLWSNEQDSEVCDKKKYRFCVRPYIGSLDNADITHLRS